MNLNLLLQKHNFENLEKMNKIEKARIANEVILTKGEYYGTI